MVNNQLCYLLLCCFVCDANNKDVVLLAFWILFLVPKKTLSPRGNAILHPSNNNIISIPLLLLLLSSLSLSCGNHITGISWIFVKFWLVSPSFNATTAIHAFLELYFFSSQLT